MQSSKEGQASGEYGAPARPGASRGARNSGGPKGSARSSLGFLKELPVLIVVALLIALIIKTFVVQAFFIPSGSMENTLLINDRVLVSKWIYDFRSPQPGNVVVFVAPAAAFGGTLPPSPTGIAGILNSLKEALGLPSTQQDFIKRVVAVGGDTLQIKNDALYVNGVRQHEPYLHPPATAGMSDFPPGGGVLRVPKGQLFVMGDNRDNSDDSRVFGTIPVSSVVGEAFWRIWPPSRIAGL